MPPIDYTAARLSMVESQLRPNKVTDPELLAGFLAVPREGFVPPALSGIAYIDDDIRLKAGRYLMEPMVMARLIQLAAIRPGDRVLEIGAGTGYGAALLSRLARTVVALESDGELAAMARTNLRALGAGNVEFVEGPLERGHAARAPYDVIFIAGAVAQIPAAIQAQLLDGGRLMAVYRPGGEPMGQGEIMTRVGATLSRRPAFDAGTPYLPGFAPAPSFAF
ncbi:MAG TPA: protein-L-isoaspartate O-methyltransferase [Stellaceae bacterium]|nr:protein-L-isoaspartate O-methyltransferase [Stellaceae bacterium]